MSLEVAAAAAGAGAWVSCLVAAQTHLTPAPNVSFPKNRHLVHLIFCDALLPGN